MCVAVSVAYSSLCVFMVRSFMLKLSYARVCCCIYQWFISPAWISGTPKEVQKEPRNTNTTVSSKSLALWRKQVLHVASVPYTHTHKWHYLGSAFTRCLPLTLIFLTHYEQIILLTHPVKHTELSIICILLLFKLPNKYFSGFMDGGHLQDSSSGGTSGRGRTLSAGVLWFCCIIHCCAFGEEEKSPVARSNGSCR